MSEPSGSTGRLSQFAVAVSQKLAAAEKEAGEDRDTQREVNNMSILLDAICDSAVCLESRDTQRAIHTG